MKTVTMTYVHIGHDVSTNLRDGLESIVIEIGDATLFFWGATMDEGREIAKAIDTAITNGRARAAGIVAEPEQKVE